MPLRGHALDRLHEPIAAMLALSPACPSCTSGNGSWTSTTRPSPTRPSGTTSRASGQASLTREHDDRPAPAAAGPATSPPRRDRRFLPAPPRGRQPPALQSPPVRLSARKSTASPPHWTACTGTSTR
jgi:hypothetical protein